MVSRRVLVVVLLACVAAAATEEVATISNADGNLLLSPVSNGTVLIEGHGDLLGRLGQLEQRCGARQWTVVDRLFPTLTSAGSSNTFTQFDMAADVPANATEIRLMVAYRAAGSSVGTGYVFARADPGIGFQRVMYFQVASATSDAFTSDSVNVDLIIDASARQLDVFLHRETGVVPNVWVWITGYR